MDDNISGMMFNLEGVIELYTLTNVDSSEIWRQTPGIKRNTLQKIVG